MTRANIMAPLQPDAVLAAVVGPDPLPRSDIVKKLWAYIKGKGLQDPKERRTILADDMLRPVFDGKDKITMFDLSKCVSKHVTKIAAAEPA